LSKEKYPREKTPCLAPMLRIGSLRGSGAKRASRKLADAQTSGWLDPLAASAARRYAQGAEYRQASLALAQGHGFL
jgi:hypothetical protein